MRHRFWRNCNAVDLSPATAARKVTLRQLSLRGVVTQNSIEDDSVHAVLRVRSQAGEGRPDPADELFERTLISIFLYLCSVAATNPSLFSHSTKQRVVVAEFHVFEHTSNYCQPVRSPPPSFPQSRDLPAVGCRDSQVGQDCSGQGICQLAVGVQSEYSPSSVRVTVRVQS